MKYPQSKDALTVLGMLCVRPKWRVEFFANPEEKARELIGYLDEETLKQVNWLAGRGKLPTNVTKDAFIARAMEALQSVCIAYDCPDPPCPGAFSAF